MIGTSKPARPSRRSGTAPPKIGREPSFDGTARDLSKLELAINTASARAAILWITITSLWVILVSAAVSVDDRRLALMVPVRLPGLGMDVNLASFFVALPFLFLLLHCYGLLKLALLRDALLHYEELLGPTRRHTKHVDTYWRRLDVFVFTRLFGPGPSYRNSKVFLLMEVFVQIGIFYMPLFLFATYIVFFKNAQNPWMTSLQAMVLFLDILAVHIASRAIWTTRATGMATPCLRELPAALGTVGFLLVAAYTFWTWETGLDLTGGDLAAGLPAEHKGRALNLAGHKLRNAKLSRVDLNGANLDGADLAGADLSGSKLERASLRGALLEQANLTDANLKGAVLDGAQMTGAMLKRVEGAGASLIGANLRHANLEQAVLPGGKLTLALLNHSNLAATNLKGAVLDYADLKEANISAVNFTAASCQFCRFSYERVTASTFLALNAADLIGANVPTLPNTCYRTTTNKVDKGSGGDCPVKVGREKADKCIQWVDDLNVAKHAETIMERRTQDKAPQASSLCEDERNALSKEVVDAACEAETAPYVARAVLARLDRPELFEAPPWTPYVVAEVLKNPEACPGAKGLSDTERHRLWVLTAPRYSWPDQRRASSALP